MTDPIEVEFDGETVEVPRVFTRDDLATWFGSIPDEIHTQRVFVYDDVLRAASIGDDVVVEIMLTDGDDHDMTSESGWVADTIDVDADEARENAPGETLWANPLEAERRNGVYLLEASKRREGYVVESKTHAVLVDTLTFEGMYVAADERIQFECYDYVLTDASGRITLDVRVSRDDA